MVLYIDHGTIYKPNHRLSMKRTAQYICHAL